MRESILQQNEELEGMRAVCTESMSKLNHVGEQLESLLVQLECMFWRESSAFRAYIDKVGRYLCPLDRERQSYLVRFYVLTKIAR